MSERYHGSCRKEKRLVLDDMEKNLKVHRKSAVRAVNSVKVNKPKETRGRRRIYNDFVIQHLKKIWLEMGQLCSRRMKKAMPRWIQDYDAPVVTRQLLLQMSKSTIDAYLRPYKAQYRRHCNSGTRPGRYIKTMIPIKPLDYNVRSLCHVEADTVHHCGGSLSGAYALTLTVTDVFTRKITGKTLWDSREYRGIGVSILKCPIMAQMEPEIPSHDPPEEKN